MAKDFAAAINNLRLFNWSLFWRARLAGGWGSLVALNGLILLTGRSGPFNTLKESCPAGSRFYCLFYYYLLGAKLDILSWRLRGPGGL